METNPEILEIIFDNFSKQQDLNFKRYFQLSLL